MGVAPCDRDDLMMGNDEWPRAIGIGAWRPCRTGVPVMNGAMNAEGCCTVSSLPTIETWLGACSASPLSSKNHHQYSLALLRSVIIMIETYTTRRERTGEVGADMVLREFFLLSDSCSAPVSAIRKDKVR